MNAPIKNMILFVLLFAAVTLIRCHIAQGQDKYRVQISWDSDNKLWSGLILMNTGSSPITVSRVQLNNRDDCVLKPIDLAKVESAPNSLERGKVVALMLSSFDTKGIFLDEGEPIQPSGDFSILLRVGEKALLVKPPRCGGIVRALVMSRESTMSVQFNKPYIGNR